MELFAEKTGSRCPFRGRRSFWHHLNELTTNAVCVHGSKHRRSPTECAASPTARMAATRLLLAEF
jgi:hypothetical protein